MNNTQFQTGDLTVDIRPIETLTLELPANWANYIVNSCAINELTAKKIHRILKREGLTLGDFLTVSEDPYFTRYHDARERGEGKGCTCLEYTFKAPIDMED